MTSCGNIFMPHAQNNDRCIVCERGGQMEVLTSLGKAFLTGGLLCVVGQILLDKTKLTPGKILVGFVVAGVLLSALGLYAPLVDWAGAGATVPLTGFGHALAKGVREAVDQDGWSGAFTGGGRACGGGVVFAVLCGMLASLFAKPHEK